MNRNKKDDFILRMCTVESVDDSAGALRIKVRIPYFDPSYDEDPEMKRIPFCFPLLPKMLHINPKVGEMVLVILVEQGSIQGDRFFVGPIVSQDYYLEKCNSYIDATSLFQGLHAFPPQENPSINADNEGTIPDRDDIAIRGRNNSDLILKKNEMRLRCGFKKYSESTEIKNSLNFNKEDIAYLQMKYFPNGKKDGFGKYNSVANIVADRINLLSHDGKPNYNLNDKQYLIDEETQESIQNTAHPLIYGDTFMFYLKQLIKIFVEHEHPFPKMPPSLMANEVDTLNSDLNEFLSKTIKIN